MNPALLIRLSLASGLVATLAGGCSAIGPTGTNTSATAITSTNEDGLIVLKFKAGADDTKAKFQITNKPDDSTLEDPIDDSPDGNDKDGDPCADVSGEFCVSFAPGDLTSNVYLVDVLVNDDETKVGSLAFVVQADAEATGDAEASGAAEEDGGDAEAES